MHARLLSTCHRAPPSLPPFLTPKRHGLHHRHPERTPLIAPEAGAPKPRPRRTVTFDSQISTDDGHTRARYAPRGQPIGPHAAPSSPGEPASVLSTLNSKIRRRHSQGAPQVFPGSAATKIGPQRTTKVAVKLKILPSPAEGAEDDEESGRDVYAQFTRIKDPTARRDAARLGKEDRARLPRVTAYCTAGSYRMPELMRYIKARSRDRGAAPKLFDECLYTPYTYAATRPREETPAADGPHPRRYSDSVVEVASEQNRNALIDLAQNGGDIESREHFSQTASSFEPETVDGTVEDHQALDIEVHTPEVFLFGYGTVVIWGMSLREEQRFLREIARFEVEKLAKADIQTEDFNFYYTREYQARIYNDFISVLMDKKNYMTKLAISHALSQSVKVC